MHAIVQDRYGDEDVLSYRRVSVPTIDVDEVLVRVRATSVHPDVWHATTGRPYAMRLFGSGLVRPKSPIPGTDLSGQVVEVGAGVTRFKVGDDVFGEIIRGNQWRNSGAFAEFAAAPAEALAIKPAGISHAVAAAVPTSGLIALANLRAGGGIVAGQRVLVNGAAGGVGSMALQIAKASGAEVTGVDAGPKLDFLRSLGADHVIDYLEDDFTEGHDRYHLILDVPGNHSFSRCRRVLTPDGVYVLIGHDQFGAYGGRWFGSLPHFFSLLARAPFTKHLRIDMSQPDREAATGTLARLLDDGSLTPAVARTFPLEHAADAMRYLRSGQPIGKVILTT